MRIIQYGYNDCTIPQVVISSTSLHYTRRPKILLSLDIVELLRSCGYTWPLVADAMQISRTTLWRYLKDNWYVQKYKYTKKLGIFS